MLRQVVVVHGGAADALVVDRKAAGLDDVQRHAQAGGQADEGPEILRNIGLEQGQGAHERLFYSRPRRESALSVRHAVT